MAPAKRRRPSFSPPRPAKSKPTTSTRRDTLSKRKTPTSSRKRTNPSKHVGRKGTRAAFLDDEASETSSSHSSSSPRRRKRKPSAIDLVDKVASNSDSDSQAVSHNQSPSAREDDASSPEPDMILAEVTTHPPADELSIPPTLVHKMLHHHFETPEKTKISANARDLVTEYLVLFLREAIVRSDVERQKREDGGGGFLEVEDLERSAVQLALDF